MLAKLLPIIFLILFVGCNAEKSEVSPSAVATDDEAFDTRPEAYASYPTPFLEDSESGWINLPYVDAENHIATKCEISERKFVNVSSPCTCNFGSCRVKVKGFDDFSGAASFKFSVTANNQTSLPVLISLYIIPVSDPPVAIEASFSTPQNITYNSNGIGNPHLKGVDADGDIVTCIKMSDTTKGVITLNSDCSFTYVPDLNYEGPDEFTFLVSDGFYFSDPTSVSIIVSHVNDPPVTADVSTTIYQNQTASITLPVTDLDVGDIFIYEIVTPPANGTLSTTGGVTTYTPVANFVGSDSFTYRVFDDTEYSNVSTVYITILPATLYLSSTGDDATGAINNPGLPFLTAQGAVNAAIAFAPTALTPLLIKVEAGNFGNVVLSQDFGDDVIWEGVSGSVIGNISLIGPSGSPGDEDGDYDGSDGSDGFDLVINSDFNIQFGNITADGGNGGLHVPDPVNSESHPGQPGNGGDLFLKGKFGTLSTKGGSGNAGGHGGSVFLVNNSTSGSIDASGGNDLCTVANDCYTTGEAGAGGTVEIYPDAIVSGSITTNGADNNGDTVDLGEAGEGGLIIIAGTVTGDIHSNGGNSYDSKVGLGGQIEVESTGIVSGNIYASAGVSAGEGANNFGGEILVRGIVNSIITVSGTTYNGNHGGDVEVGLGGTILSNIDVSGGMGTFSSGEAGSVIVSGAVNGHIDVSGADTNSDHPPGNAGAVDLNATAVVETIDATGGKNLNSLYHYYGGNGGTVNVYVGAIDDAIDITGGTSVGGGPGPDGAINFIP